MDIISTSADETSIQAVSPLLTISAVGVNGAAGAAAAASCAKAGAAANSATTPAAPANFEHLLSITGTRSKHIIVLFAGPDADGGFDGDREDLPVADGPGLGRLVDRLDVARGEVVFDHDLEPNLWDQARFIFGAAIDFGMALLA